MADCESWEDLVREVDKVAATILKEKIVPKAEEILAKHIKEDIYDAYTPKENGWVGHKTYKRRHVLEDSITTIYPYNNEAIITSTAEPSPSVVKGYSFKTRYPGAFLKLIEGDRHGVWRGGFPRPAVSKTQDDLDTNEEIAKIIRQGIRENIGVYTKDI